VGKFGKDGFIFRIWKGDHLPRHVHVYKNEKLVLKWNLDNGKPMKGKMTGKIKRALDKLIEEGKL
jgi:hypothetical protein